MGDSASYFVHETAIIDEGCQIGEGSKIWHFSHLMQEALVGKNCSIGQNVFVANDVRIGNNVKIQNNVSLYSGVVCEDDVFLGPSMVFTNVKNPRSAVDRRGKFQKTIIKKGATIGANATIVCGISLGKYAFIAAGSVVTKNVSDYAIMVGVPAIQDGWMSEYGERLSFSNGKAVCKATNTQYILEYGRCVKL
tara:strand:- start:371 stop:949 length:579 start_codon:yes stop_codon:yes gene_type:complete